MSQFNVHEWNHKRRLSEIEGGKVYVVMAGRVGEAQGPIKAFMDKASAEQHAAEFKQNYEDRFVGDKLNAVVREIPLAT